MTNVDWFRTWSNAELQRAIANYREELSPEYRRRLGLMTPMPSEERVVQTIIGDMRMELERRAVA